MLERGAAIHFPSVLPTSAVARNQEATRADALTLRSGAAEDAPAGYCELLRSVSVLDGRVRLRVEITPRGGAKAERSQGGLRIRCAARPDRVQEPEAGQKPAVV